MADKKVILIGSGGHAKVLLNSLRLEEVDVVGVLTKSTHKDDLFLGCPILGDDTEIKGFSPNQNMEQQD